MNAEDPQPRPEWARQIQAERESRGWTVTRAAGFLRRRDANMPDVATLAKYWSQRWESGRIKPGDRYRRHLLALLRLSPDIFDDRPPAQGIHVDRTAIPGAVEPSLLLQGEDIVVMAADESAEYARRHGPRNVHPVALDQLDADVRAIAVDFVSDLPVPTVLRLRASRDEAFALLDNHQWPADTSRLYSLAGWACGLLAVASSDFFGRYDAAATHGRTAWLCAEMSDDNRLRSWVRSLQSATAFWAGRWSQAAEFARQAQQYAVTSSEAARAATARARALARLGEADLARRAIVESEDARKMPSDDRPGATGFTEANRIRCAATALLWMGDHTTAIQHLQEALRAYETYEPDAYAHLTVTRSDLASAYLHTGDVDAAADALRPILSLPIERRLAGVARRLVEVRTQLTDPRLRDRASARELADRLEALPVGLSTTASTAD